MAEVIKPEMLGALAALVTFGEKDYDVEYPCEWEAPEGYRLERLTVDGSLVDRLIPEQKKTDTVIYQLHGGAYVMRYNDIYRDIALRYSEAAGGAEVISLDYGCAPNHVFPSALEESVKVYKWILEQGVDAKNIIIVGDSAGGNLALVTTMYLRDNNLSMPKGIFVASPWVDLGKDFDSMERNSKKDIILGQNMEVKNPTYPGTADLKEPYLSPVYGEFNDFPPMLIQCGDNEILLDPIVTVAEKAKEAGVDVTFSHYEGMPHDFQLFIPALETTKKAWAEITAFFDKVKNM